MTVKKNDDLPSLTHAHGWTEIKQRALEAVFEGVMSKQKLADELGISRSTLGDWMRDPEFVERLTAMRDKLRENLEGVPFVRKENRVIALAKLASEAAEEWEMHRYEVEQRPVPGGMLINERLNKSAADIYRAALDDIAREMGDRTAKVNIQARVEHAPLQVTTMELPEELVPKYLRGGDRIVDAEARDESDESDEPGQKRTGPLFNIQITQE